MIIESDDLYVRLASEHGTWMLPTAAAFLALVVLTLVISGLLGARVLRRGGVPVVPEGPRPDSPALTGLHSAAECFPPCPIHAPSDHHMTSWALRYRYQKAIFERSCPHGIGHPDPDSLAYARMTRIASYAETLGVHGCDGCCSAPSDSANSSGQPESTVP